MLIWDWMGEKETEVLASALYSSTASLSGGGEGVRAAASVSESLSSCWECRPKRPEQTLPVEFGDHRQAGQSAEDELEQHAAAARIEIGKRRRRCYQSENPETQRAGTDLLHALPSLFAESYCSPARI